MSESCCNVPQMDKQPAPEEKGRQNTVYLQISGMGCNNCVNRVRNGLLSTYGVTSALIDLGQGLAEVVYNPNLTTAEAMMKAVTAAGGDGRHEYAARILALE